MQAIVLLISSSSFDFSRIVFDNHVYCHLHCLSITAFNTCVCEILYALMLSNYDVSMLDGRVNNITGVVECDFVLPSVNRTSRIALMIS